MQTSAVFFHHSKIHKTSPTSFQWLCFPEWLKESLILALMSCYHSVCSGIIRTALPNMDREARQEYDVVIQAKDMGGHMGGLSGTTEVKITLTDVNDNPPKFPQSE